MDDNDMEIEVFSSDDIILVELICDTLEKANIEYVRTQNGTGMEGFLKIYTGVYNSGYKISVAKENEDRATSIIKEALEIYNAKIVDDEIPEELKNEN